MLPAVPRSCRPCLDAQPAGSTAPGDKGGTGRAAAAALKEQLRRHITGGAGGGGVGAGGGVVMQGPPGATPTEASGEVGRWCVLV